jgi:hypothetical protein
MFRWTLDGKKRTTRDYEELKRTSQYLARARQFLARSKKVLAKQSSSRKKP